MLSSQIETKGFIHYTKLHFLQKKKKKKKNCFAQTTLRSSGWPTCLTMRRPCFEGTLISSQSPKSGFMG